ncbi:MAG: amidohydrolase family protein [Gammaproteobacteria bacterium]|nr:amidohydrolase family protein [Gammaproteobacteria bacterium]MDH3751808.1 amidohydrolase family protein [Gammaproteobacteria bacterium]MDH3804331.1 amidohydrolase family protein [Gammaproteobacteria bacterium]
MKNILKRSALITPLLALLACSQDTAPLTDPTTDTSGNQIDLIVAGDYIVTMDEAATVHKGSAIAIDDGVIIAIGPAAEIAAEYPAHETLDGKNRIVMPGLVNGHSHAAMTLLRGVADDLALMDWLNNYMFPAEVQFVDAEFVRIGTELACWEMIRGGTTTFVDMYYYPDTIAQVVDNCGMRALISATVIDQRSPDAESAADSIQKGSGYIERWQGKNSRITPIFGPHANYTLNAEQLAKTRQVAMQFDTPISIHVSESPFEVQYAKDTYGKTSIEMLDSIGFFDGPTIAAHVVWPTDAEILILAERKVGVIHNPTSNMKIASGISPVADMLAAGVRVGLGTDGAASNNDLDMWEEMRLAAFLQKVEQMNPEVLPARTVLRMATSGGATAIGLGTEIGSLEVGKRADVIQVAFDDVHHVPTYDVVSHLVYVSDEQDVASVVVDGTVLMREGEILTVDTDRVTAEARALAAKIQSALQERNRK